MKFLYIHYKHDETIHVQPTSLWRRWSYFWKTDSTEAVKLIEFTDIYYKWRFVRIIHCTYLVLQFLLLCRSDVWQQLTGQDCRSAAKWPTLNLAWPWWDSQLSWSAYGWSLEVSAQFINVRTDLHLIAGHEHYIAEIHSQYLANINWFVLILTLTC